MSALLVKNMDHGVTEQSTSCHLTYMHKECAISFSTSTQCPSMSLHMTSFTKPSPALDTDIYKYAHKY